MKRWIGYILTFLLLSISFSAFAAQTKTVQLSKLGFSVEIPGDYYVITHDTKEDDPAFKYIGKNKETAAKFFKEKNFYLDAWTDTLIHEIMIFQLPNLGIDYSSIDNNDLKFIKDILEEDYKEKGFVLNSCEYYKNEIASFIKIDFSGNAYGKIVHNIQYISSFKGKDICFCLNSFAQNDKINDESIIKAVVDSIQLSKKQLDKEQAGNDLSKKQPDKEKTGSDLSKKQSGKEQAGNDEGILYKDENFDVTFTVPKNWSKTDFSTDVECWSVKFKSDFDSTKFFMYGSNDAWATLPPSEKIGKSRADFNNASFSKSDIAAMFEVDSKDISVVEYNGYEYFKINYNIDQLVKKKNVSQNFTYLYRFNYGYMYAFMYSFDNDSTYFPDIEKMLSSVQYYSSSGKSNSDNKN